MSEPDEQTKNNKKRQLSDSDWVVAGNIRKIRKNLKLSMAKLAVKMDISHQQLQKYEDGTNRITAGRLCQLSEFLNTPIHNFFDGTTAKIPTDNIAI